MFIWTYSLWVSKVYIAYWADSNNWVLEVMQEEKLNFKTNLRTLTRSISTWMKYCMSWMNTKSFNKIDQIFAKKIWVPDFSSTDFHSWRMLMLFYYICAVLVDFIDFFLINLYAVCTRVNEWSTIIIYDGFAFLHIHIFMRRASYCVLVWVYDVVERPAIYQIADREPQVIAALEQSHSCIVWQRSMSMVNVMYDTQNSFIGFLQLIFSAFTIDSIR